MLVLNTTLVLLHPLPDTLYKGFATNFMTVQALFCQLSLNDDLGSYAGVIFTWHPQSFIPQHAMIANKNILNGGGDSVAQV